jgi:hypothetical protein
MAVDLSSEIVLRWDAPHPRHVPLFKSGGITAIWTNEKNEAVDETCAAAGIRVLGPLDIRLISGAHLDDAGVDASDGAAIVVKDGVWSGAAMPERPELVTAGATARPWVNANGYRIGYLRALYPGRPPILGYSPDAEAGVKPDKPPALASLELALIDAWAAGGNYVLTLTPEHRRQLLGGKAEALAVWRSLGRTTHWLRENAALFRQPTLANITLLVERGDTTAELASLMYRQNASPRLVDAANPPEPDPRHCAVLVAAGIRTPNASAADRILAHAEAGSAVVTDAAGEDAWWRRKGWKAERSFEDRTFYRAGHGRLVVYSQEIQDPGEFALDVIDLAGPNRPVRLWDNGAVIALSSRKDGGASVLCAVNYGPPLRSIKILAQVPGHFSSARLVRPEAPPLSLRVASRGPNTEIALPELNLLSVVMFE